MMPWLFAVAIVASTLAMIIGLLTSRLDAILCGGFLFLGSILYFKDGL